MPRPSRPHTNLGKASLAPTKMEKPASVSISRRFFDPIPVQMLLCALFFSAYHQFIFLLGLQSGAVSPDTAPLYAQIRPVSRGVLQYAPTPIGVFLLLAAFLHLSFRRNRVNLPLQYLIPLALIFVLAMNLTVAMVDGGLKAIEDPFTRKRLEYYGDVPRVEGIREFLHDYVKLAPTLSLHSGTHPPGGVLFLWMIAQLFGEGLLTAAFSTIVFSCFSLIPFYLLARRLYGEPVALFALGIYIVTPNLVMFGGATCMDGVFAFFPILSVYLFHKALSKRTVRYAIYTGISLAMGAILTFATVCIGIIFSVQTILSFFFDKSHSKKFLKALIISGATFVLLYILLYFATGYNLISSLIWAMGKDQNMMGTGYENVGRYFHISFANLFAFLIGVGVPSTTLWLREVVESLKNGLQKRKGDLYVISFGVSILLISFSTLFTLEVERIWIFMAPFVIIAAAKHIDNCLRKHRRSMLFYYTMCLLFLQTLGLEMLLYTHW